MGPWIFGPIDFLKIAKTENTFPLQFLMTVELGNRRTTSFNESEAGPLVIRQIRLCRRGASVTPRPLRLALCPCATATTLWTAQLVGWLPRLLRVPSRCRWVCVKWWGSSARYLCVYTSACLFSSSLTCVLYPASAFRILRCGRQTAWYSAMVQCMRQRG